MKTETVYYIQKCANVKTALLGAILSDVWKPNASCRIVNKEVFFLSTYFVFLLELSIITVRIIIPGKTSDLAHYLALLGCQWDDVLRQTFQGCLFCATSDALAEPHHH